MKSVWQEMGMRDGVFRGVTPEKFFREVFAFFSSLRNQCRKDLDPGYTKPSWESYMDFSLREKHLGARRYSGDGYNDYWNYFTYFATTPRNGNKVPVGSPIPEELWLSEAPRWEKTLFSEEELLQEEIAPHPLDNTRGRGGFAATLDWHRQRYRLIQKMRYCMVPLKIACQDYHSREWYDLSGGFIDSAEFGWDYVRSLRVTFPDYWQAPGTQVKIGIFSEKVYGTRLPEQECCWQANPPWTTEPLPENQRWQGASLLRIYGVVDLSTHIDFSRYFDINSEKEEI